MTWTYASTAPEATSRDMIRLAIGDTSSSDQILTDEEVAALGSPAAAARAAAAEFARRVGKSVGNLRLEAQQRFEHYMTLTQYLEAYSGGVPYAGGISVDDKQTVAENTDRVEPAISIGMDDFPGLARSSILSSD